MVCLSRRSAWLAQSSTMSTTRAEVQRSSATRGASWRFSTTTLLSSRITTLHSDSSSPTPTTEWTSSRNSTLRRTRCSDRGWSMWCWPLTCRSTLCTWTSSAQRSAGWITLRPPSTRGLILPQRVPRCRPYYAGARTSQRRFDVDVDLVVLGCWSSVPTCRTLLGLWSTVEFGRRGLLRSTLPRQTTRRLRWMREWWVVH